MYDLRNDPHEINNLAADSKYAAKLAELRERLDAWMEDTNDLGRTPESEEMFNSDMAVYLNTVKLKQPPERTKILESNIALMKKWAREGK